MPDALQMIATPTEANLATAEQSTQLSISSRVADIHDLVPVSKAEFAVEIAPILALTAPTGMDQAERKTWLAAAYRALDGIPIALLQRGARAAMAKADHPAKIVPAISAAIDADWQWRRQYRPRPNPQPVLPAPTETAEQKADREEVAKLMAGLVRKMSANAA